MEQFIFELWNRLGNQWVVGAFALWIVLDKTGAVQKFFAARAQTAASEREQLSEDVRLYIAELRGEIEEQRNRRREDRDEYIKECARLEGIIAGKDKQINQRDDTIALMAKGESRIRHALINMVQYVDAIRFFCRKNGYDPPPFDGWRDLLSIAPGLNVDGLRGLESPSVIENQGGDDGV